MHRHRHRHLLLLSIAIRPPTDTPFPFPFPLTYQRPHLPTHRNVRMRVVPTPPSHDRPPPTRPHAPPVQRSKTPRSTRAKNVAFSFASSTSSWAHTPRISWSSATPLSAAASSSSTSLHCTGSGGASCTRACCSGARLLLGLSALSFQSPPFFERCSVHYTSFFFYFILQLANVYTPYTGDLYSYHTTPSKSARRGTFTCGLMAIMLVCQSCASCRSDAPGMAL